MRAAVYLRQSLDRTGEGLAVARQREDCVRLCEQRGWEPVEYVDNDVSASKGVRPAYEKMLRDADQGVISGVVAWDLDRLHRRPIELETFMELADRRKLALATVTGDVDLSTDNGRLFARIKGAVARAEVERKAARQRRAALQSAQSGKRWGRARSFGYGDDGCPCEPEASLLRDAYADILAGTALHSIAQRWNDAGVSTTAGKEWKGFTVRQVLLRARNAGLRSYNGEVVGKGDWEPIVGEDMWRSVVHILSSRARRGANYARTRLLTGILLCGRCSAPMSSGASHRGQYLTYTCGACLRNSRKAEPVDTLVSELVSAFIDSPDGAQALLDDSGEDLVELQNEESVLLARMDQLALDYAEGFLTGRDLKIARTELESRLTSVRDGMLDSGRANILAGVDRWDGLSLDRKRGVIRCLMVPTILPSGRGHGFAPDQLEIRWLTQEG